MAGLIGFGGTDLSATAKAASEISYRSLVESLAPVSTGGGASASTMRIDLTLKIRTAAAGTDGSSLVEAEVADGSQEVDGRPRPGSLAGQKATFRINALRKFDAWQGISFPCGAELFELALPSGRLRKGVHWKAEGRRALLRLQDEVSVERAFVFEGDGKLGGEDAWRITFTIASVKRDLSAGGQLEMGGTGEVWLAKKDLRLLRGTEVLTGQLTNKTISNEPGKFAQAMTLMDATLAPPRIASAIETPSPDSGTAAKAGGPAPVSAPANPVPAGSSKGAGAAVAAPSATGAPAERLVFVSHATGKREVWSVAPDGTGKHCLSGFTNEHWSPSLDAEGRTLACASSNAKGVNVWMIGLLAGERTALTEFGETDDIEVAWCHNGQRLVFLRDGKLWSVHRDGYNMQSFGVGGRAVSMAATNATSQVAVVTNELNQNKIVVVDVLSGAVRELFEGEDPAWSPDGTQIAYHGTDSITLANADGSSPRQLLKGAFADGAVIWEPTGKRVAVSRIEGTQPDVYLVEAAAGGKVTRVTFRGGVACAISPAADRVAYLLDNDLWVASSDGNTQVRITADGATELPVWWGKHYVP
ncbi:MAG: DPP IV N-terminal domain-containing protein [Candidatus Coatesbacteria bacterium]